MASGEESVIMPMDHTPQNKQRLEQSQGQLSFTPTLYTTSSERQSPILAVTISQVISMINVFKLEEKMVSGKLCHRDGKKLHRRKLDRRC